MSRVVYQDCAVLRVTPWEEDKNILTLLSKERSLFTALHVVQVRKTKVGQEISPNLFHNIKASLQFKDDGRHRLRGFHTTDVMAEVSTAHSPESRPHLDLHLYTGSCLLSRILQLCIHETQQDPQPYSFWMKHHQGRFDRDHWTHILADLHYCLGTWPALHRCEHCDEACEQLYMHEQHLSCENCGAGLPISPSLSQTFAHHYQKTQQLALNPEDAKLLRRFLWKRLPSHLHGDPKLKRLVQRHFHASE